MSPRGRTCLVSRLPELRRDGGARAGAPAPPARARPRARGSRCGPGRGRRGGSGRGASSTGGTGGGSAMPSSHRPDRSAASADTRPALCRAPLTTSPLADRPGGPPRPRLVGDGADAPSAPSQREAWSTGAEGLEHRGRRWPSPAPPMNPSPHTVPRDGRIERNPREQNARTAGEPSGTRVQARQVHPRRGERCDGRREPRRASGRANHPGSRLRRAEARSTESQRGVRLERPPA